MTAHALADWLNIAGSVANVLTVPAVALHYWRTKRHITATSRRPQDGRPR